jgi:hypothetical protein
MGEILVIPTENLLSLTRWDPCPRNFDGGQTQPGSQNCMQCPDFINRDFKDFGREEGYVTACAYWANRLN